MNYSIFKNSTTGGKNGKKGLHIIWSNLLETKRKYSARQIKKHIHVN